MEENLQNEELGVCYSLEEYLKNPNNYDMLKLSEGEDLSVKTEYGEMNALHVAAQAGNLKVVKYLLEDMGMDINAIYAFDGNFYTVLGIADENDNREIVDYLKQQLQQKGLTLCESSKLYFENPNAYAGISLSDYTVVDANTGDTLLHAAVKSGANSWLVQSLLMVMHDINTLNNDNKTPLDLASNDEKLQNMLKAKGGKTYSQVLEENILQESEKKSQELEAKLQELETKLQGSEKKSEELQSKLQESEKKSQELEAKLQELEAKLQGSEKKSEELQSKLKESEGKAATAESKIVILKEKVNISEKQSTKLTSENSELTSENAKLLDTMQQLQDKIADEHTRELSLFQQFQTFHNFITESDSASVLGDNLHDNSNSLDS